MARLLSKCRQAEGLQSMFKVGIDSEILTAEIIKVHIACPGFVIPRLDPERRVLRCECKCHGIALAEEVPDNG